jgi:chromate transporter
MNTPTSIRFFDALKFWLKLGFVSFGGPAGQIAILHRELVQERRWISEKRFLHALNYCMILPGPEAQQLVTYIGWLMHRTWGGVIAGALFVLPSLFILIGLSWVYVVFGKLSWIAAVLWGIKPAVVAIVVQAVHRIGSRALKNKVLWSMAAVSFVAIFTLDIAFPAIVLCAAAIGFVGGRIAPQWFALGGGHSTSLISQAPAIIDDATPTPEHAKFRVSRLLQVLALGALLWVLPMGVSYALWGWDHGLTQMGWFFTKAALLTFGGAYAVLPYVYQAAVTQFAWVTPTQMMDGLALGETTPGPLIMIISFVGFLAGYGQAFLGADHALLAGAVAACWVTWFTFLPSFIFILAGGPLVESTHNDLNFTAPLTGITAAVVGVMLNLAVFFGYHVIWPAGFAGTMDVESAALSLAAGLALFRFKRSVIQVIVMCSLVGLLLRGMGALT